MNQLERVLCIAALLATPGCEQPETDLGDRNPGESQEDEAPPRFSEVSSFSFEVAGSPTTLALSQAGDILVGTASAESASARIYLYAADGALEHELEVAREVVLADATSADGHWFVVAEGRAGAPGTSMSSGVFELLEVDAATGSVTTRGEFACAADCRLAYDPAADVAWTVEGVDGRAVVQASDLDGNELADGFECGDLDISFRAWTRTDGGVAVWSSHASEDDSLISTLTACSPTGAVLWSHVYGDGEIPARHPRDGAFEMLAPPATGSSSTWARTRILESGEQVEQPSFTEPEGTQDVLAGGLGRLLLFNEDQLGEVLETGEVEIGPLPADVRHPQIAVQDSRFVVLSVNEEVRDAVGEFGIRGVITVLEHPSP